MALNVGMSHVSRRLTSLVVALFLIAGGLLGGNAAIAQVSVTTTPSPVQASPTPTQTATTPVATQPTTATSTMVMTPAATTAVGSTPAATNTASAPPASNTPSASSTPTGTATTATSTLGTAMPAVSTNTTGATTASPDVVYEEIPNGGGAKNVVKVINKTDNRLRVRGKIQLSHIPGPNAEPENDALAYGSCTKCVTFAVALQIDLISRSASVIIPKNAAVAVNVQCSYCTTVARALQFVVQVDDPTQTPDGVRSLINQMQQELIAAANDPGATLDQTEARVNAVIAQFTGLGWTLLDQRDVKTDDVVPGAVAPADAVVLTPTTTP